MSEYGFEPVIWRDIIEHEAQASTNGAGQRRRHLERMYVEAAACPCLGCSDLSHCRIQCSRFSTYVDTGKNVGPFPRLRPKEEE